MYKTRLASNEIFSPSNKIHREVGRAMDLSATLYVCVRVCVCVCVCVCVYIYIHIHIYTHIYRVADKSLARPGRKEATVTEDFDVHISYL